MISTLLLTYELDHDPLRIYESTNDPPDSWHILPGMLLESPYRDPLAHLCTADLWREAPQCGTGSHHLRGDGAPQKEASHHRALVWGTRLLGKNRVSNLNRGKTFDPKSPCLLGSTPTNERGGTSRPTTLALDNTPLFGKLIRIASAETHVFYLNIWIWDVCLCFCDLLQNNIRRFLQ